VDPALPTTPPDFVHVTLTMDGSWKDAPLSDLFSLPSAAEQVKLWAVDKSSHIQSFHRFVSSS